MGTNINDLVLVHIDNKPGFYARIEDITTDVKPGWWQVRLLVLTIPLEVYTWILEEEQIDGREFTMGGTPVKLEKVISPLPKREKAPPSEEPNGSPEKGATKVVSLLDRKKKE